MPVILPPLPDENQDKWYEERTAFDLAVKAKVESLPDTVADATALPETVRDTVAATLVAGANITITPNDAADTITIAASGGGAPPDATETVKGVIELVTQTEMNAGSDNVRATTPLRVQTWANSALVDKASYWQKGVILAADAASSPLPVGVGTDGQVLTADAASGTGLKWATPAAGGAGIPPTLLDAKGDIIVATAADTAARLAVGSNAQVLTVDSTTGTGLKWATPASGGGGATVPGIIPRTAGHIYTAVTSGPAAAAAVSYASGTMNLLPLVVAGGGFSIDALVCRIITAEDTIPVRVLLYSSDAYGHPLTLVASGTAVTGAAANTNYVCTIGATLPLAPGLYWAAIRTSGGNTIRPAALIGTQMASMPGLTGDTFDVRGLWVRADVGTYAAPTATLSGWAYTTTTSATIPWVGLRAA